MRYFEIESGIRIPVSNEEQEILDLMQENRVEKSSLDERQQELARLMVSRGLLIRERENDIIYLRPNDSRNIWRI